MTIKLLLFVIPALVGFKNQQITFSANGIGLTDIIRDTIPEIQNSISSKNDSLPALHTISANDIQTVSSSFENASLTVILKDNTKYTYKRVDWDYEDYYPSTAPAIIQAIHNIKLTFTKAEHMPEFPGGKEAWEKYLKDFCEEHQDEIAKFGPAEFKINFVVHINGRLTDIEVVSGNRNSQLLPLAIKCLKNGPPWIPAQQNKHLVPCYQIQEIKLLPNKN